MRLKHSVHAKKQRDYIRLEKQADRNLIQFNREKYKVLHLRRNNPRHHDMLKSSFAEKALGALVDTKLNMRQQCVLVPKKVKWSPGLH